MALSFPVTLGFNSLSQTIRTKLVMILPYIWGIGYRGQFSRLKTTFYIFKIFYGSYCIIRQFRLIYLDVQVAFSFENKICHESIKSKTTSKISLQKEDKLPMNMTLGKLSHPQSSEKQIVKKTETTKFAKNKTKAEKISKGSN